MEWIIPVSVAIIAIAFCVLVYYVVTTLKTFAKSLEQLTTTVDRLEGKVDEITTETTGLIKKVNTLTDDVQEKSAKLNKIFDFSEEIAKTIYKFNESLSDLSAGILKQVRENQDKIVQVIQWGNIILELKEKWSEMKKRKRSEPISQTTIKEAE